MNATQLLAHFDRLSEAPGAVMRLRSLILSLAVSGKLVPQLKEEESAAEALVAARKHLKEQAIITKKVIWKPSEAFAVQDVPMTLPLNWIPARLNDTGFYINGLAFKPSDWKDAGIPIIRIQNLTDPLKEFNFADGEFPDEVIVRDGDLLVSWSATLEAFVWSRGTGVLNQHIFRVVPAQQLTHKRFLHLLLRNAIRELEVGKHAHGLTMTHINRGPFLAHVVLIPPLAEQHRIVAKVDELMALCDQLEAAQQERERRRDSLAAASLQRLNQPADTTNPETQREHARFHLHHFPRLTTRPEHIKALRQTVLNLAVRGKLLQQDEKDEPAPKLLEKIQAAKKRLIAEGALKVQEQAVPQADADVEFNLPSNWTWARLGDVLASSFYGPRFGADEYSDTGIPTIRTTDMTADGRIVLRDPPKVRVPMGRLDDFKCIKGDLLVTRTGSIGTMAVFDTEYVAIPSAYLIRLRFMAETSVDYLHLVLRSPHGMEKLGLNTTKVAQPNINAKNLASIPIPLPPLAEQHRIVAKVDELTALCDQLEAQLTTTQTDSRRLLEAVLHEALAPA